MFFEGFSAYGLLPTLEARQSKRVARLALLKVIHGLLASVSPGTLSDTQNFKALPQTR